MNASFNWSILEDALQSLPDDFPQSDQGKLLPYRDELMRMYPHIQYRPAAVLALLYPIENQIHTVFILRKTYDGVHSGQIAFPGGKKENTDTSLWHTALREAEEELNIPSAEVRFLRRLTPVYVPVSAYEVTPFLGFMTRRPDFTIQENEVEKFIEYPFEKLLHQPWKIKNKTFEGKEWPVYYLDVNGHHVWGATAMVIAELKDLFRKIKHFS